MAEDNKNIIKVIDLARLAKSQEDVKQLGTDFNNILKYVEQLDAIDVEGVEPLAHVHESKNVYRQDKACNSLDTEQALANSPDRSGNFIRVPLVIEDAE